MANIINGTDTGSGGLITTGDSSDELQLQTAETTAITITSGQQSAFIAGTASAPAVTTTGDLNTGIYFPAADNIGFATGGTIRGRWTTDGLCFGTDTAAANALDDYEEGTWTVELYDNSSGGNVSSTTATGYYTKIGRSVSINFYIANVSSSGLTAGNPIYFTLPFTASADNSIRTSGASITRSITFPSANYTAVIAYASGSVARGVFDAVGSGVNSSLVLWSGVISGASDFSAALTYNV